MTDADPSVMGNPDGYSLSKARMERKRGRGKEGESGKGRRKEKAEGESERQRRIMLMPATRSHPQRCLLAVFAMISPRASSVHI